MSVERLWAVCRAATLLIVSGSVAHAAGPDVTRFETREAFDLACPGLPVEDFEAANVGPGGAIAVRGDRA